MMTANDFVVAARNHDWDVQRQAKQAPPDLPQAVERAVGSMDEESRRIAVICVGEQAAPGSGELLLRMTADESPQVAADAAQALGKSPAPPPSADVIAAIPARAEPFVRSELYRLVTRQRDVSKLDDLRAVAAKEGDAEAREDAQVACVALGGDVERKAFFVRVAGAASDEVLRAQDQLLLLGDVRFARALEPWLAREDNVLRLGGDRGPAPKMARMCDLAVWCAHLMGVKLPAAPDHLDNFDDATRSATVAALRALPPI